MCHSIDHISSKLQPRWDYLSSISLLLVPFFLLSLCVYTCVVVMRAVFVCYFSIRMHNHNSYGRNITFMILRTLIKWNKSKYLRQWMHIHPLTPRTFNWAKSFQCATKALWTTSCMRTVCVFRSLSCSIPTMALSNSDWTFTQVSEFYALATI